MRPMQRLVWLLDEALDRIPAYEDGRWYRYGDWGCQLRLWKYWTGPEDPEKHAL